MVTIVGVLLWSRLKMQEQAGQLECWHCCQSLLLLLQNICKHVYLNETYL